MSNFITVKQLEQQTGHKHNWFFYDNYTHTFDELKDEPHLERKIPLGTVYECECGARELRFQVWTGKYNQPIEKKDSEQ